jgi:hypothetical protein
MSGTLGTDGSSLVGGLNGSNQPQAISVDGTGKVNVNATVSSGPTNITQINGVAVSATNGLPASGNSSGSPVVIAVDAQGNQITKEYIFAQILAGNGFTGTTGNVSTAGAATDAAFSLYTDITNTKNIIVYSIKFFGGNGATTHELHTGTTNLALGTNATISNIKLGGAASSLTGTTGAITFATTTQAVAGIVLDVFTSGVNNVFTLLNDLTIYYLPAGASRSLTTYLNIAGAGNMGVTYKWLEL